MWPIAALLLQAAVQPPPLALPTPYQVLVAEHARGTDLLTLRRALASGDSILQRLATRAIGRSERSALVSELMPLQSAPAASVRREAALAAAQMGALAYWQQGAVTPVAREANPEVRAALLHGLGRVAPAAAEWEAALRAGLADAHPVARAGAVRGLESFLRRHARSYKPQPPTIDALRGVILATNDSPVRIAGLLALTSAQARDSSAVRAGLTDSSAEVRRLAVQLGRVWVTDTAPMVRWQALRVAGDCARATAYLNDPDEHVRLLAIDLLGEKRCGGVALQPLLRHTDWRRRAHAVYALTLADSASATPAIRALATSTTWQARAWAARAARRVGDTVTLHRLALDVDPNVRIDAITTPAEAVKALSADHAGLLMQAATVLKDYRGADSVKATQVQVAVQAFERISRTHGVTWRDPRVALLELIVQWSRREARFGGLWMTQWLRDADPAIQKIAAAALQIDPLVAAQPPYTPPAFMTEAAWRALQGASARVTIRGKGVIELDLLEDQAPMAVHTFVTLAERGDFNGRTIHRIVPNFVIQGGSPGADEYDPATSYFMRDEVGAPNVRGSVGISTRGRDTGDGQLYFNHVYNVRLDFDYTVMANTVRGLDVMDRVQEGDVIESVTITRAPRAGVR
jgi:cyclophilin family peptidyl-prolyl cis-trans isomerase